MTLFQLLREHWVHILVPAGFVFGCYLDRKDDEKLTAFRNKSMLFQRLVHAPLGSSVSFVPNKEVGFFPTLMVNSQVILQVCYLIVG
jgi:NADH dehydrogenase (ubiquinone) 1 beta subcomplex subunit 1